MFKKVIKGSFISMVALFLLSTTVLAGSTAKTLSTNYTLVNFGSENASVSVQYLKTDGTVWDADDANESFNIPGDGGQIQIRQYFDTTMTAGQGSAVVSSSQPLGSIVQVLARGQVPSSGAYQGYNTGSEKWYVPLAAHNGSSASGLVNTQVVIQNVGSSAVDFQVQLVSLSGTIAYTKSVTALGVGVSYNYDLADETNLPNNWFGSAVVSTTAGSLAVVSNVFLGADALQTLNAFPEEMLADSWNVPSFMSKLANGLNTVVTVQNLSGATIAAGAMSLDCVKDPNSPDPDVFSVINAADVLNSASYNFNSYTGGASFPVGWYGSCKVNSPGDVVAFVQLRYIGAGGNNGAAAYEAIPVGQSDTTVFVPLIAKRLTNGFASVVTIQNLTADQATVTLTYTPSPTECPVSICDLNSDSVVDDLDAIVVPSLSIAANGSIMRNHRLASGPNSEPTMPDIWVGSLKVTSNKAINGFVQLTNYLNATGDTFMSHGVFTQP